MAENFRLLMIGAMYENGGNTTHRFLDGHPELLVYPFESQVGTRLVDDMLTSMFPVKYRWPVFALEATPEQDYAAIIDEECKVRARTPHVSKFRHHHFDFSDDERREIYVTYVSQAARSRATNIAAFFRATFDAWHNCNRSGRESVYVGYSPIIGIDADKILSDLPEAHVLHVVRNPWAAYADTKKRPVPLSLTSYLLCWMVTQYFALLFRATYPDRFHIVRVEDVMSDPTDALAPICHALGVGISPSLATPSWNGETLDQIYPWGTIRIPSLDANLATAHELSGDEQEEVRVRAGQYLDAFGYTHYLASGSAGRIQV